MLQAVDKEVLDQVSNWLADGITCWLATVVQTWGSSPRPTGSLLTCNRDGVIVGSLSGGCVEEDLLEKLIFQAGLALIATFWVEIYQLFYLSH